MPLLDLEARRLILVAPADAEEASAAGANHVVTHHGDEVRYLITSPTPAGLRQSELISEGMQPLVVGGLGIERSTFLSLGKSEAEMEDALAIRDFVLRGTRPGSASVIVGDGHALSAILTDALCRHVTAPAASVSGCRSTCALPSPSARPFLTHRGSPPRAQVSVLDFDTGSWPAAVADELPTAQLICFSFSPDG